MTLLRQGRFAIVMPGGHLHMNGADMLTVWSCWGMWYLGVGEWVNDHQHMLALW